MNDREKLDAIYGALRGIPEAMESRVIVDPESMDYWIKHVRLALELASPPGDGESNANR